MKKTILMIAGVLILVFNTALASLLNQNKDNFFSVNLIADAGFTSILSHTIQFGKNGSKFDYVNEGAQSVLFAYNRYEMDVTLFKNHTIGLVYQPIDVVTESFPKRDLVIQNVNFTNSKALNLRYSFPFYRVSYLYNFINDNKLTLSAGLSLQIRNATITFKTLDGESFVISKNVGLVPILKLRGSYLFDNNLFIGGEIDGFYASSSFFNGAAFDFEGSILDASLQFGFALNESMDVFFKTRFIGGTAKGTSQYDTNNYDGYTDNALSTLNFSIGFVLR